MFSGKRFPDGDRPADKGAFQIVEDRGNQEIAASKAGMDIKQGAEIPEGATTAECFGEANCTFYCSVKAS